MRYICMIALLVAVSACGTNPKPPEATIKQLETNQHNIAAIEASTSLNETNLTVRHHVKEKDVYVEVIIPDFHFSAKNKKNNVEGEGYIRLSLNGETIDEIHRAAFIVKGLPTGEHTLKIELVHNDGTSYGIIDSMSVKIP